MTTKAASSQGAPKAAAISNNRSHFHLISLEQMP
jgi:hypothetical protein